MVFRSLEFPKDIQKSNSMESENYFFSEILPYIHENGKNQKKITHVNVDAKIFKGILKDN